MSLQLCGMHFNNLVYPYISKHVPFLPLFPICSAPFSTSPPLSQSDICLYLHISSVSFLSLSSGSIKQATTFLTISAESQCCQWRQDDIHNLQETKMDHKSLHIILCTVDALTQYSVIGWLTTVRKQHLNYDVLIKYRLLIISQYHGHEKLESGRYLYLVTWQMLLFKVRDISKASGQSETMV